MRFFAFTFLLASIGLTGCDFVSSGSDGPTATVTGITFDQLPLARGNGDSWDEDGAPDVYLEIQDALGRVYVDSQAATEITQLGVRIPVDGAIRNFDREYFLYVVDQDPEGDDEDMGNIARLSFAQAATDRAPAISFENEQATLKVTLDLDWGEEAAE
ncbi:MAG: hypothetical protein AAGG50_04345 [Bacteroidota bacterium]